MVNSISTIEGIDNSLLNYIFSFVFSKIISVLISSTDKWGIKRTSNNSPAFPYIERKKNHKFQVILYHRVNDNPISGGIPVKVFERRMELLHRYFNVLPLEELVERLTRKDVPPNAVAITFDDGYQDNYENAFPILKQFGLPSTIFLTTGVLDNKNMLWHDLVFDVFGRTTARSIIIEGKEYPFSKIPEKRIALKTFLRNIRLYNPQERDKRIRQLAKDLQVEETRRTNNGMLSWKEIREMSRYNISFGAHTVTHPILSRMPLAEAVDEIVSSKETIEQKLGLPVRLFAYPNGSKEDFNIFIKQALKKAGFLCAVTTIRGANSVHADPFELRRVWFWDKDPQKFILRLGWSKL